MERADIIRMAREAGAGEWGDSVVPAMMDIEKFAALVAAHEREACAMVCDEVGNQDSDNHAWDAAAAIRARSNQ